MYDHNRDKQATHNGLRVPGARRPVGDLVAVSRSGGHRHDPCPHQGYHQLARLSAIQLHHSQARVSNTRILVSGEKKAGWGREGVCVCVRGGKSFLL